VLSATGDFVMEIDEASQKELNELFQLRGGETLKRFGQALFSGIENPQLLSILEDVKGIWRDRYRPTLTSLSCEAVGGKPEEPVALNLIVALAGAGIGIHDDIIDKSIIKRSKKTILGLHGIEGTLLAGDLLIVKGLTEVKEIIKKGYQPEKVVDIIDVLQRHYFEICEGVIMERLWRKNVEVDLDFCHQVLWKYGSDGEACARLGAIAGNGTEAEVEALGRYGRRSCYVFRLAQEVRDVFHLEGDLLRRLKHESVPLPILYAARVSKENMSILKSILKGSITSSHIKTVLELCFKTEAFTYVRDIAQKNIDEGLQLLNTLKSTKARDFLVLMIKNVFPYYL
jgi:geranylgeranyl pyrophosphate synthase